MFPLTFVSSALRRPGHDAGLARSRSPTHNPFTIVTNASRALYNGLPAQSLALQSVAWSVGIIVVFATLSIRKFNRSTVA